MYRYEAPWMTEFSNKVSVQNGNIHKCIQLVVRGGFENMCWHGNHNNCNLKLSVTSLENYVSQGNKGNFWKEKTNKHYVIRRFYYKRV